MLPGLSYTGNEWVGSYTIPADGFVPADNMVSLVAKEWIYIPEFEYVEEKVYKTAKTEFILGKVQATSLWPRGKRIFNLQWQNGFPYEKEQISSFIASLNGSATEFVYQPQDPVDSPELAGTPGQVSGGSLGLRTYYFNFTWVTAQGETLPFTQNSFVVSANNLFTLTVPKFPKNVTAARVYISTVSGTLWKQTAEITSTSSRVWTEGVGGLATGTSNPPTTNTAFEKVNVTYMDESFVWTKSNAGIYQMSLRFEESL